MAIPSIMQTGYSGLIAAKAGMATSGHNITNANTEGFSRQRVILSSTDPLVGNLGHNIIGTGTKVVRVERINDEYVEKQVRNAQKDYEHCEEKDLGLRQVEDIFNEMNGDGLNRLISRFFNEFRKLSDEPESVAVRQSVREATQAVVNDFHRLRKEVEDVRNHLDLRIENFVGEVNQLAKECKDLNDQIRVLETTGETPNDLLDKRDVALKKLGSLIDISGYKDQAGNNNIDLKGLGPLVSGAEPEHLWVERSSSDAEGKPEGAIDIHVSSVHGVITHKLLGGRLGALLETRDKTVSTVLERLDHLAYHLVESVNAVHVQGVAPNGAQNILYFKSLQQPDSAAEMISLSDAVLANVNNIATALEPESPGDNRVAIAISQLQNEKLMSDGHATVDEWYNSIVSDVGVATAQNRFVLNQQKDIVSQLNKLREQLSGVSIDEETTHLLEFQHTFDASAKVIQAADEMLKTVLNLKRD